MQVADNGHFKWFGMALFKVCREFKIEKNGDYRKFPQTKALFKLSLSNVPCVYFYILGMYQLSGGQGTWTQHCAAANKHAKI